MKKAGTSVFFLLKICCLSKDPSCQAILTENPFYKIINKSQIGGENWEGIL